MDKSCASGFNFIKSDEVMSCLVMSCFSHDQVKEGDGEGYPS